MNTIHQSSQKNPDLKGRFGSFGGRFVPETLMHALDELESAFFLENPKILEFVGFLLMHQKLLCL